MSFHRVDVGNKVVGIEIVNEGDRVVAVRRALPKHMLKKPLAWAFSAEVIRFMRGHGVEVISVICDGVVYSCNMNDFLKLGVPFNRGSGAQRHLPLPYWKKSTQVEKQREVRP